MTETTPTAPAAAPRRILLARATRLLSLALVSIFFVVPLWWLLFAPSKTEAQLFRDPPLSFGSLDNVVSAWNNLMTFGDGLVLVWLRNSIWYSAVSVLLAVAVAIPAGFALAVLRFPGRKAVLFSALMGMVIPAAAVVIPIYRELDLVNLTNTPWAVILPGAFFPFGVYLAYLHFSSILPREVIEAALLDGATYLRVFVSIGLPLSKPAVGLVVFFGFVANWNNFFLPFVMLVNDRLYNLQVGLAALLNSAPVINAANQSDLPIQKPEAALAALITLIPIAIIFLSLQRLIARGLVAGSVKE
jgi:multiple sugar transport system permease protein